MGVLLILVFGFIIMKSRYIILNGSKIEDIFLNKEDLVAYYNEKCIDCVNIFEDDELEAKYVKEYIKPEQIEYSKLQLLLKYLTLGTIDVDIIYDVDYDGLEEYFNECNETAKKSVNATYQPKEDKTGYIITHEVTGTKIDITALFDAIDNGERNIKLSDYYKKAKIKAVDLQKEVDNLNKYLKWSIKYSNNEVVAFNTDSVYYDENKDVVIDYDYLKEQVELVTKSYNTVGKERTFKTTHSGKIRLSGGTYGSTVDTDKEYEWVLKKFNKLKSVENRKPIYIKKLGKIGNTYIEVSKEEQTVYVYKDGKLINSSSCVTGKESAGHGTPTGIYYISERIDGKWLTGDGYRTWVNKWMRLTNTGVGLHDANWRGVFGGNIYYYSGSHGCINLPASFASWLFDNSYVNMPVFIY